MIRRYAAIMALLIIGSMFCVSFVWAYDGAAHKRIILKAVETSLLNAVLRERLGFSYGDFTMLTKDNSERSVLQWIAFGAEAEDYGINGNGDWETTRAYNHFHDPLKAWDEAGFENLWLNPIYWAIYGEWPVSAILWGLDSEPQDKPRILETTGNWSWTIARDYYYQALTATSVSARDEYFADCFRAIGQLMHLLQDMSVPLHTRNDVHAFPIMIGGTPWPRSWWTYETYVSENPEHLQEVLNHSAQSPHSIVLEVPQPDSQHADLIPVTGLFDRNVYDGTVLPVDTSRIGLAEYSNAFFLTQDTMFTYPHPSLEETNLEFFDWLFTEPVTAEDGKTDERIYLRRREQIGPSGKPFAAVDYFFADYRDMIDQVDSPFLLDKECWREYAEKLIPKAVGYSAELIDYFFRGRLQVVWVDEGIEVINRSQELMHNGTFELFYENSQGERIEVSLTSGATVSNLSPGQSMTISFDPPCNNEEDCSYLLVYRGGLGNENDALAGEYFKPPEEDAEWYDEELFTTLRGILIDSSLAAKLGIYSGYYRVSMWRKWNEPDKTAIVLSINKWYGVAATGWPFVIPKKNEEWVFSEIELFEYGYGFRFKGHDLYGHTLEFTITPEISGDEFICHRVEATLDDNNVLLTTQSLASRMTTCGLIGWIEPPWTRP